MSLQYKRQLFGLSCPSGGDWYACASGSDFAGCCAQEACDGNGCPSTLLEPASFNAAYYGKFPDLACPTGSKFYTCTGVDPPFWGCCKSNPCSSGCPADDLEAAYFDSPVQRASYSATGGSLSVAATSTSGTRSSPQSSAKTSNPSVPTGSLSAGSTTSSASITNALTTPMSAPSVVVTTHKSTNVGAIAGGAAGGVAVLAIIIGLLIYFGRHAAKSRKASKTTLQTRMSFPQDPGNAEITEISKSSNPRESIPPPYKSPTPSYTPYHNSAGDYPTPNPAYELPSNPAAAAGYYKQGASPLSYGSVSRKPISSSQNSFSPHRLSEAPGDARFPVELDSAHHTPNLQTPHTPQSPSSGRSSAANWTAHPWQAGPERGLAIEEEGRDRESGGLPYVGT